jgi:PAS domain S-box-containing protein
MTDDEFVRLGERAVQSAALRLLLLPGRLLFTIPDLYRWSWGPRGPASQLIANYEGAIDVVGPGRLRFETHMKPGYEPSRENYLLLRGSLQGLSKAAGAGPAKVEHVELNDGALYHVTVSRAGGPLRLLPRAVNWMLAARSTADALRRAHEELNDRYVELRREIDARAEVGDRLTGIIEASVDGIVGTTVDGVITHWNPAAERIYGYAADEVLGRPLPEVVPDDRRNELEELINRLKTGERIGQFETERVRKDGRRIHVNLGVAPLRDRDGSIAGFTTLVRDVTGAVEAERRRLDLEARLLQAQRLESVGRLAGGIAHDFNNTMTAILGFARLTMDGLPPDDRNRRHLEAIESAAQSASGLVQQLLAFGRQQVLRPEVLDVSDVVAALLPMVQRLIGEDIQVSVNAATGLWPVEVDRVQLEQILVNLAVNARDAMPRGGRLTIEATNAELDASNGEDHIEVAHGEYVLLAVSDTGIGMDAETQARIFEPFYTTKDPARGTGLGLATVYGVVRQSAGHIWVYSELGHGTTFKIYLPRTSRPVDVRAPAPPSALVGGHETVLVVEDEEILRTLVDAMLSRLGYSVVLAADAESAVDVLHGQPIDAVVTDVVMPGATGVDLARRLRVDRPDLPILFMSGYSEAAVRDRGHIVGSEALIEKPFTAQALGSALRRVLDGGRAVPRSPREEAPGVR